MVIIERLIRDEASYIARTSIGNVANNGKSLFTVFSYRLFKESAYRQLYKSPKIIAMDLRVCKEDFKQIVAFKQIVTSIENNLPVSLDMRTIPDIHSLNSNSTQWASLSLSTSISRTYTRSLFVRLNVVCDYYRQNVYTNKTVYFRSVAKSLIDEEIQYTRENTIRHGARPPLDLKVTIKHSSDLILRF